MQKCANKAINKSNNCHETETTRMWAMPIVMAALQYIGGALRSMPQSLARAHCSTAVQ